MQAPAYHRSYRHLSIDAADIGWGICCGLLPGLVLLIFAPVILRFHGRWVVALLEWIGVPLSERVTYFGQLAVVVPDVTSYNMPAHSLYPAAVAIGGFIVAILLLVPPSRLTPLRVICGLLALVCGTSGAFFYFAADRFPYTAGQFADVWTRAEFIVWLIAPLLLAIILGTLPLPPAMTLLYSAMTLFYAVWFSAIRLTLSLTLFHFAGLIWMPAAYFLGGFMVDFLYVVGYYSIAVSRTTRMLRDRREVWQW
jgi:hypothetical protein